MHIIVIRSMGSRRSRSVGGGRSVTVSRSVRSVSAPSTQATIPSSSQSVQQSLQDTNGVVCESLIKRFRTAPLLHHNGRYLALLDIKFTASEVFHLCNMVVGTMKRENSLVRLNDAHLPLTICGDIHGQLREVRILFEHFGDPERHNYLFMGDYADRATQGVETLMVLFAYKFRYPQMITLLRGNHEDINISLAYGLFDECIAKYGQTVGSQVWMMFINVFNHMPLAALVNDRVLAMHGGLSPSIRSLNDINRHRRPSVIPAYGMACDLMWADPSNKYGGWALSKRGVSYTFDDRIAEEFCEKHKIDFIVRGHQISDQMKRSGYSWSENRRVLTLFTASDYIKSNNTGATLTLSKNNRRDDPCTMSASFTLFIPKKAKRSTAERRSKSKQPASRLRAALHRSRVSGK